MDFNCRTFSICTEKFCNDIATARHEIYQTTLVILYQRTYTIVANMKFQLATHNIKVLICVKAQSLTKNIKNQSSVNCSSLIAAH